MNNFDDQLKGLLSKEDEVFIENSMDEKGFYKEAFDSLNGPGKGMIRLAWGGVTVCVGVLFFGIYQFFQAETVKDQIMWAAVVLMTNSAQIALKLWFHDRLNRFAIIREIKRLQLEVARSAKV